MVSRGLCWVHGGGENCMIEDCQKRAVKDGKCRRHGEKIICSVQGCECTIFRGRCYRHGIISPPTITIPYRQSIQRPGTSIRNPSTSPLVLLSKPQSQTRSAAGQKVSTVVLPPLRSIISNSTVLASQGQVRTFAVFTKINILTRFSFL